ncbi:MAG: AAA family ATPase [Gemmatales bacterium]|nr:AAA family ATPase [Gemmatales bacterium]
MKAELPTVEELQPSIALLRRLLDELDRMLLGRTELHRLVVVALLSRGHVLLEGVPGVGKTTLIKALGQLLQLDFRRVQFTPDLMPSDILGSYILQESETGGRDLVFRPGPIFTNLLLADEINRASPKTQSALLEAMQERQVTLLGTTRPLPEPFFVLASQNPIELEGTYPLPEAQLDRFLFKLLVEQVSEDVLVGIISTRRRGEPPMPCWALSREELAKLYQLMERIYLPRAVSQYIARLVAATHPQSERAPPLVKEYVTYGSSPRGAIALAEAARAHALLSGRPTVGFEDVRAVAIPALQHRVLLAYKARLDRVTPTQVIEQLLEHVPAVPLDLPEDLTIQNTNPNARES